MKILKALLSTSVLLVYSFSQALAAPPGPPGAHLDVTQVFVDDPDNPTSIMIIGTDLDFGSGPLSVTLGEFGALTVTGTPNDTLIEADLPAGIFPGDFLLTISNGNGQSQNDEYDLTIGAVGPQGDQGVQGKLGDTGAQGVQGKLGDTGAQGVQGKLGDTGAQGAQGKIGPAGPPGAPGGSGSGITGYQIVVSGWHCKSGFAPGPCNTIQGPVGLLPQTVFCPAGKRVLSGGFEVTRLNFSNDEFMRESYPIAGGTAWFVNMTPGNNTYKIRAYALCATF